VGSSSSQNQANKNPPANCEQHKNIGDVDDATNRMTNSARYQQFKSQCGRNEPNASCSPYRGDQKEQDRRRRARDTKRDMAGANQRTDCRATSHSRNGYDE
jgi:hypothetical protein